MVYQVKLKKSVIKSLEKVDEPNYSQIKKAIYKLADNPRPQGCIKLKGRNGYRIRVSNYRIIYDIFDKILVVEVVALGHRKDIYD